MNTSNNSLAEHLEKLARDMVYPPLNGGPTQEEIISALKASAEIIGEYEHYEDLMEDLEDFAAAAQEETEKIKSIIAKLTDQLDSVLLDLSELSEGLKKTAEEPQERMICKTLEEIEGKIRKIYRDLRRA